MDEQERFYPGGLKIVNDLYDISVPKIFTDIVKTELNPKKLKNNGDKELAADILSVLRQTPKMLDDYIRRQRYYNIISWENMQIESERNICKGVMLDPLHADNSEYVYKVSLNQSFCDKNVNDIKVSLRVTFRPSDSTGRCVNAKIIHFDLEEALIFVLVTDKKPHINLSQPYDLHIAPSPFNFRSRHRVLGIISNENLAHVVFPNVPKDMISRQEYMNIESAGLRQFSFPESLKLNKLQKLSIIAIVNGHYQIPFILYGPPGTGKTTTLVEAVAQLLKHNSANRLLICTPSNTAADLFTLAMIRRDILPKESILRMFSTSKLVEEQNKELIEVAHVIEDEGTKLFGIQPVKDLEKYRVIISTLSASSYLVSGGLKGFFSHIIVDEAGQADELDTLIPIVGLSTDETRIVLAGDPRQLGPVETAEFLKPFNLNISLLERFMNRKCYKDGDRRVIIMLRNNYRSHESLVEMPSKLFYNLQLIASSSANEKASLCQWNMLPSKNFPMLFHSISSPEEVEEDGFSWRNIAEAELVVEYVKQLIRATDVLPKQIGIISPYRYQIRTLRGMLVAFPDITIDSVERYQGSERRVIIVSTVRSSSLGFLDCDKRLNTTITRAQELLVIIGCHNNLRRNRNWKNVIEYCRSKNALIGAIDEKITIIQKHSKRTCNNPESMDINIEGEDKLDSALYVGSSGRRPRGSADKATEGILDLVGAAKGPEAPLTKPLRAY
ncbi:AAA domain-containing protein [Ditylenchus destructor]|uniref:AAA domain-containing protein n=1 Tax=Ditylenchus destructor TaxID=166010 RepID=A0AAD4NFT9_9BILA|nr:AAA domain-containing protein [Ditylenchus destructor]